MNQKDFIRVYDDLAYCVPFTIKQNERLKKVLDVNTKWGE